MCDPFCGAFNSCSSEVHSYFIYQFFQELRNLGLGRFTAESCYPCLSLILIDVFFFDNLTSIFLVFIQDLYLFFFFRDSLIELLVPVILFFYHFHDG